MLVGELLTEMFDHCLSLFVYGFTPVEKGIFFFFLLLEEVAVANWLHLSIRVRYCGLEFGTISMLPLLL